MKRRTYHNNLGLAYSRKGQFDLAFREFKLAIGETSARNNIARLSGCTALWSTKSPQSPGFAPKATTKT